jgi:hypothetical protein
MTAFIACHPASFGFQAAERTAQPIVAPSIRLYRLPFESVTRLFPPGTDLESISYDELVTLSQNVATEANRADHSTAFLGSVEHDLEVRDRTLHVTSRFATPGDGKPRKRFRTISGWLDADYLIRSRWNSPEGTLFVTPDGQIAIDAAGTEAVVRWSVPALDEFGSPRFPARFPSGVVTRIRCQLPDTYAPATDSGRWLPEKLVSASGTRWTYAGTSTPKEIRLENRSASPAAPSGDYDADSHLEWTVSDDEWTGIWTATLRSSSAIPSLRAGLPADVFVTACSVNGSESQFVRSADDIVIPLSSETGRPVAVRIEMKRIATSQSETTWPSPRPLEGRWFLFHSTLLDLRANPFVEVIDSENGVPATITIEQSPARSDGPLRIRFSSRSSDSKYILRTAAPTPAIGERITGEMVVRSRSIFASLRYSKPAEDQSRLERLQISTKLQPVRVESYRTGQSGTRTACDFEIITHEDGFELSALPSDPAKGPLTFEISLSQLLDEPKPEFPIEFPVLRFGSESIPDARWSVLSDDPKLRLKLRSPGSSRWLPILANDLQAKHAGALELAPSARKLVSWISDKQANPAFMAEAVPNSLRGAGGKSLLILLDERANRRIHSLQFERSSKEPADWREVTDSPLAIAVKSRIDSSQHLDPLNPDRTTVDHELPPLRYRYASFEYENLPAELAGIAERAIDRPIETLIVADPDLTIDKVLKRFEPDATVRIEIEKAADAALEWVRTSLSNSDRIAMSVGHVWISNDFAEFRKNAESIAETLEQSKPTNASPLLRTGPIAITTEFFENGSAISRLATRIPIPINRRILTKIAEGCDVRGVWIDGKPVPIERSDPDGTSSILANVESGEGRFEIEFATKPESFDRGTFPVSIGFADVSTSWAVRSADSRWTLVPAALEGSNPKSTIGQTRFETNFDNLNSFRAVRPSLSEWWPALPHFIECLAAWAFVFGISRFIRKRFEWPWISAVLCALGSFVVIFVQSDAGFAILTGAIMCLTWLLSGRLRSYSSLAGAASLAFSLSLATSRLEAQSDQTKAFVPVAIPFEKIENVLERPTRAVLAKTDLNRLREFSTPAGRNESDSKLLVNSATHAIEPAEQDSFRLVSKYRIVTETAATNDNSTGPTILPLVADDALQVRAYLGETELPVRVDRASGQVEIRFDRPPAGELTVRKTFLIPHATSNLRLTILPAIGAKVSIAPDIASRLSFSFLGRDIPKTPDQEIPIDLASVLTSKSANSKSTTGARPESGAWFTAVRTSSGVVLYARFRDDARTVRTMTFDRAIQFLDTSDCDAMILPGTGDGKRRVRIAPTSNSFQVRVWFPNAENETSLGELIDVSPAMDGSRAVLRLATSADVVGNWSILSDSTEIVDDPFEQESAATEADATIRNTVEVPDWKAIRWRFVDRSPQFEPEIESVLTLEEREVHGRFNVEAKIPEGALILRSSIVSFDAGTTITSISGADLLDSVPVKDRPESRRIFFQAGTDGVARFEIRTRTKVIPALPGESVSSGSRSPLPWPRIGDGPLVQGKLIVERRIDPESSFRSSPIRLEQAPIDSLGEIRTAETPVDVRQWLYNFRGAQNPPDVGWQLPGVYCHVEVSHTVELDRDGPFWHCEIRYSPMDGPLASIMFEVNHQGDFVPAIDVDAPKSWQIEKLPEAGKTRYRLRPDVASFGKTSIRLRGDSDIARNGRFILPGVSPLGHGRVDKLVTLRTPATPNPDPYQIETHGLQESVQQTPVPQDGISTRSWRFRAADARFEVRFDDHTEAQTSSNDKTEPRRPLKLRNLAFVRTDDDQILWYATANIASFRNEGLTIPDEAGTLTMATPDGNCVGLERRDGRVTIVNERVRNLTGEVLVSGRFSKQRVSLWFETMFGAVDSAERTPIHFAVRSSASDPNPSCGIPVSVLDWITDGISQVDADANKQIDALTRQRILQFGASEFGFDLRRPVQSEFDRFLAQIASSAKDAKTDTRHDAAQYIDTLLLENPDRWNFFRYDPIASNRFARPSPPGIIDRLSSHENLRGLFIAICMTTASLLCRKQLPEPPKPT